MARGLVSNYSRIASNMSPLNGSGLDSAIYYPTSIRQLVTVAVSVSCLGEFRELVMTAAVYYLEQTLKH